MGGGEDADKRWWYDLVGFTPYSWGERGRRRRAGETPSHGIAGSPRPPGAAAARRAAILRRTSRTGRLPCPSSLPEARAPLWFVQPSLIASPVYIHTRTTHLVLLFLLVYVRCREEDNSLLVLLIQCDFSVISVPLHASLFCFSSSFKQDRAFCLVPSEVEFFFIIRNGPHNFLVFCGPQVVVHLFGVLFFCSLQGLFSERILC